MNFIMTKLYRSRRDKKISGLCGGVAHWLGVDATLVRLVTAVAAVFSFGTIVAIYLIGSLLLPEEPAASFDYDDSYYSKY